MYVFLTGKEREKKVRDGKKRNNHCKATNQKKLLNFFLLKKGVMEEGQTDKRQKSEKRSR